MMKKALIIIGAASFNKGSEALLSSLVDICIKAKIDHITVSSADLKRNQILNISKVNEYLPRYTEVFNKPFILKYTNILGRRFGCSDFRTNIVCNDLIRKSNNFNLIIIVGADNFDSKKDVRKKELNSLIDIFSKKSKAKIMLFNCSINENNMNSHLIENVNNCDIVTVRDKISYKNMEQFLNNDKLYHIPDPAFTLKSEFIEYELKKRHDVVGINVSNAVTGKEGTERSNLVYDSYCNLIEYITMELKMKVLLIPHVMRNTDLSILSRLYRKYNNLKERIFIIDDESLSARQLKYIISNCRFFVGARTHASIAAYSSCVPSLVLGYSIKSIGIANDIFGTDNNYVISVNKLKSSEDLVNGFKWLTDNEDYIRNHLINFMPAYVEDALKAADLIKDLVEEQPQEEIN